MVPIALLLSLTSSKICQTGPTMGRQPPSTVAGRGLKSGSWNIPARRIARPCFPKGRRFPPGDVEAEHAKQAVGDFQGEIIPAAGQEFVERRLVDLGLLRQAVDG